MRPEHIINASKIFFKTRLIIVYIEIGINFSGTLI